MRCFSICSPVVVKTLHQCKMVETLVETMPPAVASEASEPGDSPEAPAAPKKKGRPAGAKDKTPRKKKGGVLVEYIQQSTETASGPSAQPAQESSPSPRSSMEIKGTPSVPKPVREPPPTPEPPSPRTTLRESARHMLELRRLNDAARKTHLGNAYTRRLAAF